MIQYGRHLFDFGCLECNFTGYLEARDARGLTVSWPCDCRRKEEPKSVKPDDRAKEKA